MSEWLSRVISLSVVTATSRTSSIMLYWVIDQTEDSTDLLFDSAETLDQLIRVCSTKLPRISVQSAI